VTIDKCPIKVLNDDSAVWSSTLIFIETIKLGVVSDRWQYDRVGEALTFASPWLQAELMNMNFVAIAKGPHLTTIPNVEVWKAMAVVLRK